MEVLLVGPVAYHAGHPALQDKMEASNNFYQRFHVEADSLSEQTLNLKNIAATGGERKDATDAVRAGISRLTNEVADAADYSSDHDRALYAKILKALREQLDSESARLTPKSKFAFKPRSQASTSSTPDTRILSNRSNEEAILVKDEKADELGELPTDFKNYNEEISRAKATSGPRKPSFSTARDISLGDHSDMHILLPASASRATSSGTLQNISKSIVDMSVPTTSTNGVPFASLMLRNIDKSLIVAGHVEGPAHITGVTDSIVIVNARQIRIHDCKNVDFYLFVNSHPIIENCEKVGFAPMPAYHGAAGSDAAKNQWDQVDDFKWIKSEPSPHWSVLPEGSRISEETWTKAVAGEQNLSVGEILAKVGVPPK